MACFTYSTDDVLGFAVDYTTLNVIVTVYLNGVQVDQITLPLTASTQEIVGAVTLGTNFDTDSEAEILTYEQVFHYSIPDGYEPLETPTGYTGTEYLSTGGYISHSDDDPPNRPYHDDIKSFPNFRRSTDVAFTGQTKQPFGDIVVHNEDGSKDNWLNRSWGGRDLRLFIGDRTWPRRDFRDLMTGTSHELTSTSQDTLSIRMRDKGIFLEKNIQETQFTTGPSAGLLKPICYGECYNIEPVLEDHTIHKYRIHDGAISAITAVYDRGVSISFTPNLSDGSFTLSAQPDGIITCDVQGATFVGYDGGNTAYYDTVGNIMYDIINNRTDLTTDDIDGFSLFTFDEDNDYSVGYYSKDEESIASVFDFLVKHVSGFWGFNRNGKLRIGRLISPNAASTAGAGSAIETMTSPIESYTGTAIEDFGDSLAIATGFKITSDDIVENGMSIKSRNLPYYKATLGYKKYWRTLGTGDIAGVVGMTTDVASDLQQEYRLSENERALTKTHHLLASETEVIGTALSTQADADKLSEMKRQLFDRLRTTYIVDAFSSPFGVDLGDVIEIEHNRFGFDNGEKVLVVGYSESISPDRIRLEVWA